MKKIILILVVINVSLSCNREYNEIDKNISLEEIPSPSNFGAQPNLFSTPNGETYLSWVQIKNDTAHQLYFAQLNKNKWSPKKLIAEGNNWFVNWADFPSIAVSKNERNIAVHWLQKRSVGTYDYDVHITQSDDLGKKWSPSFIPHTDNIAAEHGFVTMLPLANGRIFATWLDGRNTKTEGAHGYPGAMTLRVAEFDSEGNLFEEVELDARVCDCCQTDATASSEGLVVVYRDRSEDEIRDINIVRQVNGKWTSPKPIFKDNWEINGCPVNGPAITSNGLSIAVAWYSMAGDKGKVKVAFSKDGGANFSSPIQVDEGDPLGRVDITFASPEIALVSWVEQSEEGGEIRLAKVNTSEKIGESIIAAKTKTSRQSGFPILEKTKDNFLLAWTVADSVPSFKTASISLDL